ncbi:MAG: sulfite exporter TauE/SafE family protein [Planctomycetota bacterium]|nr:sulfite exporter TauE/SafE family protein [Planctomycetota bacterium]
MHAELGLIWLLSIPVIAFVCEYVDSTVGMGYGTTLTPLLLILGFGPLQIVPAVLFSELCSGLLAGLMHHSAGNVDFSLRTSRAKERIHRFGLVMVIRRTASRHLKVAALIASCSIAGTAIAVLVAVRLDKFYLTLWIGGLVLAIGVFTLATVHRQYRFSWKRIMAMGLLASFNKGLSGGGYGPVVTGGQILAGVDGKNAVAITSLAEGLTCLVGFFAYFLIAGHIEWTLVPYITIGALFSVPLSAYSVKRLKAKHLRLAIGGLAVVLGAVTVGKALLQSLS